MDSIPLCCPVAQRLPHQESFELVRLLASISEQYFSTSLVLCCDSQVSTTVLATINKCLGYGWRSLRCAILVSGGLQSLSHCENTVDNDRIDALLCLYL